MGTSVEIKMFILINMHHLRKPVNFPFRYMDEIQLQRRKILQRTLDFVLLISEYSAAIIFP